MASGIMNGGATLGLAAILPGASNVYIALLTQLPSDADGTGLVEASGNGYARVAVSAWLTITDTSGTKRVNQNAITFSALTGALNDIVGWAIYTASSGGTLLGVGSTTSQDFIATDQPQFAAQTLGLYSKASI